MNLRIPNSVVAFVWGSQDIDLLSQNYSAETPARVSLVNAERHVRGLGSRPLWIDPNLEGLANGQSVTSEYSAYVSELGGEQFLAEFAEFARRPARYKSQVREVVWNSLDRCRAYSPKWISVPQLGLGSTSTHGAVNKALAEATGDWRKERGYPGDLILPVVVTHQRQVARKTDRNPHVRRVVTNLRLAGASGIWVVESSLTDSNGSPTNSRRFKAVVDLHQELREALGPDVYVIAGPYWGLNLVLWARGLCDFPAVSMGSAFQYYLPGLPIHEGKHRIVISPLRRAVVASPELEDWAQAAILKSRRSGNQSERRLEALLELADRLPILQRSETEWRRQVASFYSRWIQWLESLPSPGRAIGLYHDFSAAYVFGSGLPQLPRDEAPGRKAGSVAKHFMLACL